MKGCNVFSFHASIFPVFLSPPPPGAGHITPSPPLITVNRRPEPRVSGDYGDSQAWVTANLTRNVNCWPPHLRTILVCLTRCCDTSDTSSI